MFTNGIGSRLCSKRKREREREREKEKERKREKQREREKEKEEETDKGTVYRRCAVVIAYFMVSLAATTSFEL